MRHGLPVRAARELPGNIAREFSRVRLLHEVSRGEPQGDSGDPWSIVNAGDHRSASYDRQNQLTPRSGVLSCPLVERGAGEPDETVDNLIQRFRLSGLPCLDHTLARTRA